MAKGELLFEQYKMSLKRDKYDIEVLDDDTIKINRIFFDLMQRTYNLLDWLYMDNCFGWIDTIKKYQFRKQSAA